MTFQTASNSSWAPNTWAISPEQQRLCLALRGEQFPRSEDGWLELAKTAGSAGLTCLLYGAIEKHERQTDLPLNLLARLRRTALQTQAANLVRLSGLSSALRALNQAGIPVIVLKGAALVNSVYPNAGLRPMADVDILVRLEHAEGAKKVLLDAGYCENNWPELRPGFAKEFLAEVELTSPLAGAGVLEIHWRLIGPLFASRFVDEEALWRRAEPAEFNGQPAFTLSPEDWLLHIAAHAGYKHRSYALRDIWDVDALLRQTGERLDWERLLQIGDGFHWLPALGETLRRAVVCCQSPVPDGVIARCQSAGLPRREEILLRWWLKPSTPERHHIFADWITLPTWGARWRMVRAYLFPSRQHLNARFPQKTGWPAPFLYVARFWKEATGGAKTGD